MNRGMSSIAGLHGRSLQQPWLLCQQGYINGNFVDAASGNTLEVFNPASGKVRALCTISLPSFRQYALMAFIFTSSYLILFS